MGYLTEDQINASIRKHREGFPPVKRVARVGGGTRKALELHPEAKWCAYCEAAAETWDHVIPFCVSQDNSRANLVPCCLQCNTDKSDLPVIVFLALTVT